MVFFVFSLLLSVFSAKTCDMSVLNVGGLFERVGGVLSVLGFFESFEGVYIT